MVLRETLEKLKNKPQQLENPDLKGLRSAVAEYIDSIYDETYHEDSDIDHYIFETAIKLYTGKKYLTG